MNRSIHLFAWAVIVLLPPAFAAADTTVSFTGTVTAIVESEGFFEAPASISVGSPVAGVITHFTAPDAIYDPEPADCAKGYVFENGTMVITVGSHVWDYTYPVVMVDDCASYDLVEYQGQAAVSYPSTAPAHVLSLKLYDQTAPYTLVDSLDLPLGAANLDLDSITRMSGRILNVTWGEIRFDVDAVTVDGGVANEPYTWDQVKALYSR